MTLDNGDQGQSSRQRDKDDFEDDSTYVESRPSTESRDGTIIESAVRNHGGGGSYRRHRPRKSGGFLLESAFASPQSPETQRVPAETSYGRQKAFQTNGGSEVKKSPLNRHRTQKSASLGGSPLAATVTNSTSSAVDTRQTVSANNSTRSREQRPYTAHPFAGGTDGTLDGGLRSASDQHEPQSPGHRSSRPPSSSTSTLVDPDPLQIVNLALNLSESRRRTADTARRAASSGLAIAGDASNDPFSISTAGGSLKNQLQQSRRSRAFSSDSNRQYHHSTASPYSNNQLPGLLPSPEFTQESSVQPRISDATLARVEKAKAAIELGVQYRKLLQYLPPIQSHGNNIRMSNPSSPLSQTFSHSVSRVVSASSTKDSLGRQYNPLQSIRNRKVRARDRKPINAEAQGWTDSSRVASWIEAVEEKSTEPSFLNDETVDLPVFSPKSKSNGDVNLSPTPQSQSSTQYRRPSRDWMVAPEELLADAYWLEQGTNKKQIEDRDGNKIYPGDGLSPPQRPRKSYERNHRNDGSISGAVSKPADMDRIDAVPLSKVKSELSGDGSLRGRRRQKLHDTFHHHHHHSGSDNSKSRRYSGRSSSAASSSSGREIASFKGKRKRKQPRRDSSDLDSKVLEKQMMEMLKKEAREMEWGTPSPGSTEGFDFGTKKSKDKDSVHSGNVLSKSSNSNSRSRSDTNGAADNASRKGSDSMRDHVEALPQTRHSNAITDDIPHGRTSMDGLDITAPSSPHGLRSKPIVDHVVPSIALNLSAPASRNVSPTRKPLPKAATVPAARNSVERTEEGGNISETDFAVDNAVQMQTHLSRQSTKTSSINNESSLSKSPIKKLISRNIDDGSGKELKRAESRRRRAEKEEGLTDSSKLRGIFKGGRIEEIVRSEVSKVGDFIWKKEPSSLRSRQASPGSSYNSDSDDMVDENRGALARTDTSRTTTRSKTDELDASTVQTRYFMGGLPSFKSPFGRPGSSRISPEPDQSSTQQALPEQQRPSRFERPVLPQIDVRAVTPLPKNRRTDSSRRSAAPRIEQRRSSYAQSDRSRSRPDDASGDVRERSQITSIQRSDNLGEPGEFGSRNGRNRLPVTALTALDASGHRSRSRGPRESPHRAWSISDRGVSISQVPTTRREIARVRALLLSSGVKANEIQRKSREMRSMPSIKLSNHLTTPLAAVSSLQEHQSTAQILVNDIELSTKLFEDNAKYFRNVVISKLFDQIAEAQEVYTSKLTPLVRASADEADAFSTELTTTHTLAIKQLNDSVYTMARRRRRRLRWVRRGGFVLLEWMLLGVMWFAWFVVVIIRLVRGTARGVIGSVRWLFWL